MAKILKSPTNKVTMYLPVFLIKHHQGFELAG